MSTITSVRRIAAPTERVFSTVADITNFSKAVPQSEDVKKLCAPPDTLAR